MMTSLPWFQLANKGIESYQSSRFLMICWGARPPLPKLNKLDLEQTPGHMVLHRPWRLVWERIVSHSQTWLFCLRATINHLLTDLDTPRITTAVIHIHMDWKALQPLCCFSFPQARKKTSELALKTQHDGCRKSLHDFCTKRPVLHMTVSQLFTNRRLLNSYSNYLHNRNFLLNSLITTTRIKVKTGCSSPSITFTNCFQL